MSRYALEDACALLHDPVSWDLCECGDWRWQHAGSSGRCLICSYAPVDTVHPCKEFRFARHGLPEEIAEAKGARSIEFRDRRIHRLKTWPRYWQAVHEGRKTFEFREDDRGYAEGDLLLLLEWEQEGLGGRYTGRSQVVLVTYLMRPTDLGLSSRREGKSPIVVMSICHPDTRVLPWPRADSVQVSGGAARE